MKTYGDLWPRIVSFANLHRAAFRARRGVRKTPELLAFMYGLEPELLRLQAQLMHGEYMPGPYRTFTITDPKRRLISAAPFRDRVVHHAVCDVMEPVLERIFAEPSFACRRGKGTHAAVDRARRYLCQSRYFLKCDIRRFFDSVDHTVLKQQLAGRFREERLLRLLYAIVDNPVPGCSPGRGLAIGNLTSQHFANLFLTPLDLMVLHRLRPRGYIRYMDDFVLFDDSLDALHGFRFEIERFLYGGLRLRLKQSASFAAPARHGLPFLGMQLFRGAARLDGASLRRLCRRLRLRRRQVRTGEISPQTWRRCLASAFGHLSRGNTLALRRKLLNSILTV